MTEDTTPNQAAGAGAIEETDFVARLQALQDQGKLNASAQPDAEAAPALSPAEFAAANTPLEPAAGDSPPASQLTSQPLAEYHIANGVERVAEIAAAITAEVKKAVVGQEQVIESALAGLFAQGHVLLEGVPGTAKTLLVRALAAAIRSDFGRIQFTPDLMPSDITGSRIYDMQSGEFHFKRGPIFTGLLLADEINRTPPKTQAALLESMQEGRVTIDGEPFDLPPLFMVFATQNPVEFEGTYPLPEAQLDRFLLKIVVDYPSSADEQRILRRIHEGFDPNDLTTVGIRPAADGEAIELARRTISTIRIEDTLFRYIVALVAATRDHRQIVLGASPRASIALLQVSKALAAMRGRDYVIPDDIKAIAPSILRHRLILRPEAEIEGTTADRVIEGILDRLEVPR